MPDNEKIELLKGYFSKKPEVLMAFVFGSYAQGQEILESDFDVAVYFRKEQEVAEVRKEGYFDKKDSVWSDISRIMADKEIDLVCLNYAPASLVSNVIKTGVPLTIKDRKLYWEIYLQTSLEAEDFLHFLEDFRRIKQKAASLNPEEKERLMVRLDYLEDEFKELDRFKAVTREEYLKDRDKRRLIERWLENILNATIDIAKIFLASEKKGMPRTYEEALDHFGIFAGLNEEESQKFSKFANLRNILAHEYLDILYREIQNFVKEAPPSYEKIFNFLETYLKN